MARFIPITLAASFAVAFAAHAATPVRLRGTIISVSSTTLTLQTLQNQTETVQLNGKTHYAAITKSSLNAVQPGGYIGAASKTVDGKQVAIEVVVFPPALRGTGEGHYAWDNITDTTAGGTTVHSSMTNGNVMSALPPRTTASSMTNGNVAASSGTAGDKQLTVTYQGGQQIILLPPTAPIVSVTPANAAILKPGVHVFVVAMPGANGDVALAVNAGANGITPPM
jgi:hypothetical protein